jgi:hypothetical protein
LSLGSTESSRRCFPGLVAGLETGHDKNVLIKHPTSSLFVTEKGFQWLLELPVATGNDNITNSEYTIWSWNVREGLNLFNKSGKAGQLARNDIL